MNLTLPKGKEGLEDFARALEELSDQIGFRLSSRGWCYQLEGFGLIDKAQFDKVERVINRCRGNGLLPVDFTAEEEGRQFSGVEDPEEETPPQFMRGYLEAALDCEEEYTPDWWEDEDFYIQLIVEKIDLKTLFQPICEEFHIPIATSKGWSSMLQRAEYARRFAEAEDKGLGCVLLYCGDHDPDGTRISDFLRKNLEDLQDIVWADGASGYDPTDLKIERFGLNYDFIDRYRLTWIDNLITGSKRDLASPGHPNHFLPYVQDYLATYGARKCEANALVVRPVEARQLVTLAIEDFLGPDARRRFEAKRQAIRAELYAFRQAHGLQGGIEEAIRIIDEA